MPDGSPREQGSRDRSPSLGGHRRVEQTGDEPRLGGEAALPHIFEALEDPDLAVRQRAAEALGKIGGAQAIARLLALLRDEQADLRALAARGLGRARSAEAVGALLEALRDDNDSVRRNAAEALGRIGDEGAVGDLLGALRDRDQTVRERAAEALGVIGETLPPGSMRESIPPALLQALRVTSSIFYPRVSHIIARSLSQMGDSAVPALIDALCHNQGRLSETAAEMLAAHCLNASDPLLRARIITALLRSAAHREPFIARAAIRALGAAAPAMAFEGDTRLARWAIRRLTALCGTRPARSDEPILVSLDALARAPYPGALAVLDASYARPDLIRTLGRLGVEHPTLTKLVIPTLIEALYDDDHWLRRAAVEALALITEHQPEAVYPAVPALASRLTDDTGRPFSREPRISDAAAAVLARLGTPDALRALEDGGRTPPE